MCSLYFLRHKHTIMSLISVVKLLELYGCKARMCIMTCARAIENIQYCCRLSSEPMIPLHDFTVSK